jgi:hypothetical protein
MRTTQQHARCRSLTAIAGLLALCGNAWSAGPAFGSNCSFSANTLAEGGSPDAVLGNPATMTGACGGDSIESHGTIQGQRWTGDDDFAYSFAQGARASAGASAGLGVLRANAYSSATSTPAAYFYVDNTGQARAIDNEFLARSQTSATSYWYDEITVNQGTVYGPVVLRFTLTLSGTESVVPGIAGAADISARFIIDDDRNRFDRTLSLDSAGSFSDQGGFTPGTVIKIFGDLSARTDVRAGGRYLDGNGQWQFGQYVPDSEAIANASNTAGFQIEVLTEGASYTSASGHSYVTAVPEPASAALLGAGLFALLGVVRRRR